ncbi:hypothetical protein [Stieleria varia]|uniref:Uncharacterized protein n=1 Tax=Stieleria varia TaxID=2528005 RepID=A0A5C6ATB9_9BACT|nr:hypothetical protein [Stieleria varia]TWU02519.1 hypothetical protein Pla52n_35690 [Stieleria varia]
MSMNLLRFLGSLGQHRANRASDSSDGVGAKDGVGASRPGQVPVQIMGATVDDDQIPDLLCGFHGVDRFFANGGDFGDQGWH